MYTDIRSKERLDVAAASYEIDWISHFASEDDARSVAENNHVLCNKFLSPSSVGWMEDVILSFCKIHAKTTLDHA